MDFPVLGQTLYVEQAGAENRGHARLLDLSETAYYIDLPMVLGSSVLLPLDLFLTLRLTYRSAKGTMYYFDASVLRRGLVDQLPCLLISRPQVQDIVRVQRRAFARIEVPIDLSVLCVRDQGEPKLITVRTVTRDISGGGLSFCTRRNLGIGRADPVTLKLSFVDDAGQSSTLTAKGEITRVERDDTGRYTYSMKFIDIKDAAQQKLVQYVFRLQLKERVLRG
ncbi:MAG: PilZ domain-containing protein [Firmicutes bacterium]|nr:PilZ domain-containing protein [Bacillota bacterium]